MDFRTSDGLARGRMLHSAFALLDVLLERGLPVSPSPCTMLLMHVSNLSGLPIPLCADVITGCPARHVPVCCSCVLRRKV